MKLTRIQRHINRKTQNSIKLIRLTFFVCFTRTSVFRIQCFNMVYASKLSLDLEELCQISFYVCWEATECDGWGLLIYGNQSAIKWSLLKWKTWGMACVGRKKKISLFQHVQLEMLSGLPSGDVKVRNLVYRVATETAAKSLGITGIYILLRNAI